jgi:hypothetical protein
MVAQGKRSVGVIGTIKYEDDEGNQVEHGIIGCAYRTSDGLRCGVGLCIPDSLYDPDWEDSGVSSLLDLPESLAPFQTGLLQAIQNAHDKCNNDEGADFLREFARNMREHVAEPFELSTAVLNAALQEAGVPTITT